MSTVILCAMPKEAKNIKIEGANLFIIGIGAINVISRLSSLIADGKIKKGDKIINVGYAGSSFLPIGSVVSVKRSSRLAKPKIIKEKSFKLRRINGLKSYTCNTVDDFEDGLKNVELVDMELTYICSFFENISSIKIVSDGVCYSEYKKFRNKQSWEKVNNILRRLINDNN